MTARMGVSDGRSPQEVLLEEFYRSECSETVRVGRVIMVLYILTFTQSVILAKLKDFFAENLHAYITQVF
jgi:hypothetical protein